MPCVANQQTHRIPRFPPVPTVIREYVMQPMRSRRLTHLHVEPRRTPYFPLGRQSETATGRKHQTFSCKKTQRFSFQSKQATQIRQSGVQTRRSGGQSGGSSPSLKASQMPVSLEFILICERSPCSPKLFTETDSTQNDVHRRWKSLYRLQILSTRDE